MTKRLYALLLVLLLCAAVLPAAAQSIPVYRLLQVAEDGSAQLLGIGVLLVDQDILLTSLPALPEDTLLIASGEDGAHRIVEGRSIAGAFQLLWLEEPSALTPMTLAADEGYDLCVGLMADNTPVQTEPEQVQQSEFGAQRLPALEMTLTEGLLPGAFRTDGYHVSGLAVARHIDGDARYTLLEADVLLGLLQTAFGTEEQAASPYVTDQVSLRQEGCRLVIDWHDAALTSTEDGAQLWSMIAIDGNPYYKYHASSLEAGLYEFIICPGQRYRVWACVSAEDPGYNDDPAAYAELDTAEGAAYTDHGYTDTQLYLGVSAEGQPIDAENLADPLPDMTASALAQAEHVWLQAVSTYQVDAAVDLAGCVTLITPEGYIFTDNLAFSLLPEVQERDVWAYPLDALLDVYARYAGSYAPGMYTVVYYFGDQPVSVLSIELE